MAMNSRAQMTMPGSEDSSGRPCNRARRRAWAPANRQKMIQPFANSLAMPITVRLSCGSGERRLLHPLVADALGDQESQFQRLAGIEPRIAGGLVAVLQVDLFQSLRPAQTFGDVLPGHFEMHAAGMSAFGAMDGKESAHLFQHPLHRTGLVARLP